MSEKKHPDLQNASDPISFQTEIKQLLNILVHSLYTRREIFLRELLSNASDALTQLRFKQQTEHDLHDPELDLEIRISGNADENILQISDTGVGMTAEELKINLGTIAQSGARAFLEAAEDQQADLVDVIGKFGVGFYSVFMAAEWVQVETRSYLPEAEAATWFATGDDTFQLGSSEREKRGTTITIKLKEDAAEFAQESRLREIIKTHSDYIPYPIYVDDEDEQVNRQVAIWRESPRQVEEDEYQEFYRQLTLDFETPLETIHFVADAPLKIYALLYLPAKPDRDMFTLRDEDGLKLYARKVLIEEYSKELLPPYFRFIEGVVDAEDLPLNVSRESVQVTSVIQKINRILTNQVIQKLKIIARKEDSEKYENFWERFGQFIKEGVASDESQREQLSELLRFRTSTHPDDWTSLDEYLDRMKPGQDKIYYILGEDGHSVSRSPHLDFFQNRCIEVLTLTDPVDPFLLIGLREYKETPLQNIADSDLEVPEELHTSEEETSQESLEQEQMESLITLFKDVLGDKVADVRSTDRLTSSVARLVDAQGSLGQEMQRVYRMMDREFKVPKKVLELNPNHQILKELEARKDSQPLKEIIVEQIFESTLLIEGMHPDPSGMADRIQDLMELALKANQE